MRVNMRITQSLVTVAVTFLVVGCMDINPPTSAADISQDELLHSISLPFSKAVYAVGYRDSVVVTGRLVNGDTFAIDPSQISWSTSLGTQVVTVDSSGILNVNGYTTAKVSLYASYQNGEISRADTATIYISSTPIEIQEYSLTSLDSAKGGYSISHFLLSGGLMGTSKFEMYLLDGNNSFPPSLPADGDFLDFYVRSVETGEEVPFLLNVIVDRGNITIGNYALAKGMYWIGVRSYIHGVSYADSVLYQSLPPAEILFQTTNSNNQLSIVPTNISLQPCSYLVAQNLTMDTIMVDLSAPIPDRTCGGEAQDSGTIIIVPGQIGMVRRLGYSAGQSVTWTATAKGRVAVPITGRMNFVDPN